MRFLMLAVFLTVSVSVSAQQAPTIMGLNMEPESHADSYQRSKFLHWIDSDQDHENTRQEVLIIESLVDVTVS